MIFRQVKQILERWSMSAISRRLDKRLLQHEIDVHRMFLLTSHHVSPPHSSDNVDSYIADLATQAESLHFQGMQAIVADRLRAQLRDIGMHLSKAVGGGECPVSASPSTAKNHLAPSAGGLGTAYVAASEARIKSSAASNSLPSTSEETRGQCLSSPAASSSPKAELDAAAVAQYFLDKTGFTLKVAPSSIAHLESGAGLWVQGMAQMGQIVALYPGVVYKPNFHRALPGYPMVASSNPFLLSRFDGAVIDAKPWGRGRSHIGAAWPESCHNAAEEQLGKLEGRHPLALAHFANHPPIGQKPNAMIAAFEWQVQDGFRRFLPNVMFAPQPLALGLDQSVSGLALVAVREVKDEELLLNYRLNPNLLSLPDWYSPVDAEEDRRRWG